MPATYTAHEVPSLKFQHPCSIFVSGASGCGKTEWIKNVIENDFIDGGIKTIYFFMPYCETPKIVPLAHQELVLMEGVPTKTWIDDTFSVDGPDDCLIVVDDLWSECIKSPAIRHLLKYGRSHFKVSMIFVTQYYFEGGKPSIPFR